MGYFKYADDVAANVLIGINHLLHAAGRSVHEFVGKKNGERLITDDIARAPNGMTEA